MQRLAVLARLKPGTEERAAELVAAGPPFDPRAAGFERHTVFIAHGEAVFVFEGGSLGPLVELLHQATDPSVLGAWDEILDGMPRVAREAFAWTRPADAFGLGWDE